MKRRHLLKSTTLAALTPYVWAESPANQIAARFFARPQMTGAALSPDGKNLAIRSMGRQGRAVLSVLALATMQPQVVFTTDTDDVDRFVWVNNERLAFDLQDSTAPVAELDAGPGLFAVDKDGKRFRQLVERQVPWIRNGNDGRRLQPWNTFLLNGTTQRSGNDVLVWHPEAYGSKEFGYIKLLRLNTLTGVAEEVEAPLHSVGWWADSAGQLRVVETVKDNRGSIRWRDPVSGEWRILREFDAYTDAGALQVRHVGADGRLYVASRHGDDRLSMWVLDPMSGEFSASPLASSPRFDVDAEVIERRDRVLGLRFTIDAEVTQWLAPEMQSLQESIDKVLPRTTNRISVPWSGDEPWVLIEAFSDVQPTLFLLFNRATGKFTRLGAMRPDVDARQQAQMDLKWLKARDGLALPTWVSTPPGSGTKPLPTVVLVHGGPWVKNTSWDWNAEVQFLNTLGYAVLQPQFRGTQGFGSSHEKASWRQWGRAMQDDVADATQWAIDQGIADPGRIAIMGASYGGYSTLMGLARHPELYRCGVAWVAVTDLDLLYGAHWSDFSDAYKRYGMPTLIGDRIKDAAELRSNSPINLAPLIRQPLLLAHGQKDVRVPIEHGNAMRRALKAANNTQVEWITYAKEGHGWRDPGTQIDFWTRVAKFLGRHLA